MAGGWGCGGEPVFVAGVSAGDGGSAGNASASGTGTAEQHGGEVFPRESLLRTLHQTIAKITQDFSGRWHFNTCIASIMILVNEIVAKEAAIAIGRGLSGVTAEVFRTLTLLLAPFAPFLAAELWEQGGGGGLSGSRGRLRMRSC